MGKCDLYNVRIKIYENLKLYWIIDHIKNTFHGKTLESFTLKWSKKMQLRFV